MEPSITTRRIAVILIGAVLLVAIVSVSGAAVLPRLAQQAGEPCILLYPDGTWTGSCELVTETPIPPTVTATMEPTPTLAPTNTATPEPTATATPEPTPAGHDTTSWHPVTEEAGHHHGVDPSVYIPIFGQTLIDYLAEYGEISYPWQTPNENEYKHMGYIWLYTQAAGGCEQFNISGEPNCITESLVQVHTIGTAAAALTRFHSFVSFSRVCSPDGATCGIVQVPGHFDFGLTHSPYKGDICDKASDPPGLADDDDRFQPPYIANPNTFQVGRVVSQFWNVLGPAQNLINEGWYPDGDLRPNWTFGYAFSSPDAWQTLSQTDCANPDAAYTPFFDGFTDYNHSQFVTWSVKLDNLPPAPFDGFTNRWGHVVDGCTEAGLDCVPLVLTEGVPAGTAWLNRSVNQGNPPVNLLQEFDNGMGWIQFPEVIIP